MGDGADDALDRMMDMDELQCRYGTWEEACEAGVEEELYDYDGSRYPNVFDGRGAFERREENTKTCRCCGTGGLHWSKHNGKWRLCDINGIHQCTANPLEQGT